MEAAGGAPWRWRGAVGHRVSRGGIAGIASGEFAGGQSSVEIAPANAEPGWPLRIRAGADGLPEHLIMIMSGRTATAINMSWRANPVSPDKMAAKRRLSGPSALDCPNETRF
jgi:hypothetical protein